MAKPLTKGQIYGWKWQQARRRHLQANPLCVMCRKRGRVAAATVVDHIIPHKGDLKLFWDRNNWQSLCGPDHDSIKQQFERTGYSTEVGLDGWPIDPAHPANAISGGANQVPRGANGAPLSPKGVSR